MWPLYRIRFSLLNKGQPSDLIWNKKIYLLKTFLFSVDFCFHSDWSDYFHSAGHHLESQVQVFRYISVFQSSSTQTTAFFRYISVWSPSIQTVAFLSAFVNIPLSSSSFPKQLHCRAPVQHDCAKATEHCIAHSSAHFILHSIADL